LRVTLCFRNKSMFKELCWNHKCVNFPWEEIQTSILRYGLHPIACYEASAAGVRWTMINAVHFVAENTVVPR
ncbi:hypothetical protein C3L33_22606, partial [Rhododendron williamsianum]